MDYRLLADNLLSAPVLFFLLGILAVACRADLKIPQPIPKLFSLYLLWAIGFKGGIELARAGWSADALTTLAAAVAMSALVPLWSFAVLRLRLDVHNAAAVAASYGSISAVTFIAAVNFLERQGIPYGGHLVTAMALMESPAIIVAVMLSRTVASDPGPSSGPRPGVGELIRESVFNGPVFLLLGSVLAGLLCGPERAVPLKSFSQDIFHGVLTLFLLDMGLVAASRMGDLRKGGWSLIAFGVVMPLVNGAVAIAFGRVLGLPRGDALLFAVLCASASYIAVPAAIRSAIPQASASIYLPMALAVTFPFNIAIGIPLYLKLVDLFGVSAAAGAG